LLTTTQQVGGSLGLAIMSTVSTTRLGNALDAGSTLPLALTHGFKGAFIAAAALCALGLVVAMALLPSPRRKPEDERLATLALSFARCPTAPYCGHLGRLVAAGRRVRGAISGA
jgi:predicted MFS family arabinose efflux permease